ncbi:MAG TPA: AI-2E family transporter [Actinomycetota bacterium]|nr:AI-2E family transporter [Actinomycetota bacterium]
MPDRGLPSLTVVRLVAVVAASVLVLYAAYAVRHILILVLMAMFFAVGLDPVVRGLRRFGLSRGLSVLAVSLLTVLFLGGFVAAVTPPLVRQTQRLAREIPDYANNLSRRSERFRDLDRRYDLTARARKSVDDLPRVASRSAGSALGVARSVGRAIFSTLTVIILTIYFLLDLPGLLAGASRLLPATRRERFKELSVLVFERISGYIVGNVAVSVIAGVVSFIALSLLGVPFALPLAMWVAIADLIPMVGATLGAVPAVIVAFFSGTATGVGTMAFFAAYQQAENYLVVPRVMRRAVNISPAAVILSALIGGTLLGFVGVLIAVPLAASLKVLAHEVWIPKQDIS